MSTFFQNNHQSSPFCFLKSHSLTAILKINLKTVFTNSSFKVKFKVAFTNYDFKVNF